MKIIGIDGMTQDQVAFEIQRGGKFVTYLYCISIVVMTFRRGTDIYFIRAGESAIKPGLPFVLLSLVAGWWGIPWGPIYTIWSLVQNLRGGKDVTQSMVQAYGLNTTQAAYPQAAAEPGVWPPPPSIS